MCCCLVASLRHIPLIISLHGSDIFIAQSNALFKAVAQWSFSKAAGVLTCSPDLNQAAIALGAPKNTLLIPHGANPEIYNRCLAFSHDIIYYCGLPFLE
jgi:hypothetical protein